MKILEKIERYPAIQFLIIALVVLMSHLPILVVEKMENPDASYIFHNLRELDSVVKYIRALISFDTLDFQPVRDLTLFLDIEFFRLTGLSISVLINCLVWAGCCFQLLHLISMETRQPVNYRLLLYILCLSVYPIFYSSVNWGIARKHLLALFFILKATRNFIHWENGVNRPLSVILPYVLACLSIPIAILWPIWAAVRLRKGAYQSDRSRKFLMILSMNMILLLGINWAYYKTSLRFLSIYPQKVSEFDPFLAVAHIGIIMKQLLFPYQLGFYYAFDGHALWGVVAFFIMVYLVWKLSLRTGKAWDWFLFGALAPAITLSTPNIYYDTYTLLPAVGMSVLIYLAWSRHIERYWKWMLVPFFIWGYFTWKGNFVWKDPVEFYAQSQRNHPNCSSAAMLGIRTYMAGKLLPNELYEFNQINDCFKPLVGESSAMVLRRLNFESLMMIFETEIDVEYRDSRLRELGKKHLYPQSLYLAFLARQGRSEDIEIVSKEINEKIKNTNIVLPHDFAFSTIVPPYCEKHQLQNCLEFVKRWKKEPPKVPYF